MTRELKKRIITSVLLFMLAIFFIFTNFNFTSYMPIGKHLTERYMAFLKNYQPFAAFGDETIAILRFFLFEIKKLNEDIPGMEEFISLVMSDFKKLHNALVALSPKHVIYWKGIAQLNTSHIFGG